MHRPGLQESRIKCSLEVLNEGDQGQAMLPTVPGGMRWLVGGPAAELGEIGGDIREGGSPA